MGFLNIETRKVNHHFTEAEKRKLAEDFLQIEQLVKDRQATLAAMVKLRKSEIGEMEAKAETMKVKYLQGFEEVDSYVLVKKDYLARQIIYIDPITFEIVERVPFSPYDEMKQLRMDIEVFEKKVNEKLNEIIIFFDDNFGTDLKVAKELFSNEEVLGQFLEDSMRFKHVSMAVKKMSDAGLISVEEEVDFDAAFDSYNKIYVDWLHTRLGFETPKDASSTNEKPEPMGNLDPLAFPLDLPDNSAGEEEKKKKPKSPKKKDGDKEGGNLENE